MDDLAGAQESTGAENTAIAQNGDIEATARRMGWRPKEEYKGDESKWVEADAFVARIQDEVPVLKRTLRDMDSKFAKLEQKLAEQTQVLTDFREFASRGEKRAYERALAELTAQREVAVAHADTEGFKAAEAAIAKLNEETKPTTTERKADPPPRTETTPQPVPEISDWMSRNSWFNTDTELHEEARLIDASLMRRHPGMPIAERLEMVTARVRKEFPEKFGNVRRDAAATVAQPGGQTTTRKRGRTYDDLPSEAKRACDKFVKTIPGFTRDQYVKDFDWSEA